VYLPSGSGSTAAISSFSRDRISSKHLCSSIDHLLILSAWKYFASYYIPTNISALYFNLLSSRDLLLLLLLVRVSLALELAFVSFSFFSASCAHPGALLI
jgi:hypothetical protein